MAPEPNFLQEDVGLSSAFYPFAFRGYFSWDEGMRRNQRDHVDAICTELFGPSADTKDWTRSHDTYYFRHERDAAIFKMRFL